MKWVQYLAVLSVSFVLGWEAQLWFDSRPEIKDSKPDTQQLVSTEVVPPSSQPPAEVSALDPQANVPTVNKDESVEWTAASLMEAIHAMDDSAFVDFINSWSGGTMPLSDELMEALLDDLLTISDPSTRHRMIQLLGDSRFANFNNDGGDKFKLEDKVMAKILGGEQSDEWLDVLSYWGVLSDENATQLATTLGSNYASGARVSTLLALSRRYGINQHSKDESQVEIAAAIRPFLDSKDELERAAATRALKTYPGDDLADRLSTALNDPSEKVRISAAQAMAGRHRINTEEIKNALMNRMQSPASSALERLTSYLALQNMPLEGKHYEAVYEFRINSADKMTKKHQREQGDEPSPWM